MGPPKPLAQRASYSLPRRSMDIDTYTATKHGSERLMRSCGEIATASLLKYLRIFISIHYLADYSISSVPNHSLPYLSSKLACQSSRYFVRYHHFKDDHVFEPLLLSCGRCSNRECTFCPSAPLGLKTKIVLYSKSPSRALDELGVVKSKSQHQATADFPSLRHHHSPLEPSLTQLFRRRSAKTRSACWLHHHESQYHHPHSY